MYRSRNRGKGNNIKGPNSALTQFLKEEGISAETIRQRWIDQQEASAKAEPLKNADSKDDYSADAGKKLEHLVDEDNVHPDLDSGEDSEDNDNALVRTNRKRPITDDSDEEEITQTEGSPSIARPSLEKRGNRADQRANNKKILEARRRRKRKAEDLLDKKESKVPTLQDLCLELITNNIISWQDNSHNNKANPIFAQLRERLGGVSTKNLALLSQALSKNRALNDYTLQLFLKTDLTELTFHDCSNISYDGYKTLAVFSPHITSLSLQMCGQLNNEALLYICEKLPNLHSLYLDGPFLINDATWNAFFTNMKGRLRAFHISNTHRFTDENLESLLSNCHNELVSLGLSRLDSVFNYAMIPQYLDNENFHTLSIQYPYNEEDVSDEVIVNIVGQVGKNLKSLTLNGCLDLTDSMIINGLGAFASGVAGVNSLLEVLRIEELDQVTSDALVYFLSQVSLPNLKELSLKRCLQLDDAAIEELLLNAASSSLQKISLNSLKSLTKSALKNLKCPNLKYLDLGFVRAVDDEIIELLGEQNPNLKVIEVFGDNLITANVEPRPGITLVGRQSDSM